MLHGAGSQSQGGMESNTANLIVYIKVLGIYFL